MGNLHLEMSFLSVIGDWLEGGGWTDAYFLSNISTPGRVDSFLQGSQVKRTRYAFQLTLHVLLKLAQETFKTSGIESFESWKKQRIQKSPTAKYWFTAIDLILILFMFVRSIRESNFKLYVKVIELMLPWYFALDHTNYSRWLTIALDDLKPLKIEDKLYQDFSDGKFTFNKTERPFSSMGEDQSHEQNNKIIKGDGGTIGIFNKDSILDWAITGPIIAQLLNQPEAVNKEMKHHHEDTERFKSKLKKDVEDLMKSFQNWNNPFLTNDPDLIHLTSNKVLYNWKTTISRLCL